MNGLMVKVQIAQDEERLFHADVTVFVDGNMTVERDIVEQLPFNTCRSVITGAILDASTVKFDHPATQKEVVEAIWRRHLKEY